MKYQGDGVSLFMVIQNQGYFRFGISENHREVTVMRIDWNRKMVDGIRMDDSTYYKCSCWRKMAKGSEGYASEQ